MRSAFLLFLFACISFSLLGQVRARTEDNKEVILFNNGTWVYGSAVHDSLPLEKYTKPISAVKSVRGKNVLYRHYYDPEKWLPENSAAVDSREYAFTLKDAFVNVLIIPENIKMDITFLKTAAIQNALALIPDIHITSDELCIVNGTKVYKLIMKGTIKDTEKTYYCLYYAGARGVVQVVSHCASADFDRYKTDMEEFLYGFTLIID